MPWLLLLFVVLPAVEIYVLIQLGQLIGGLQTFGLILATGLLGSYMAKKEGLAVWMELNKKLGAGQMPGTELIDGAIILVSGTLLVTPGVLTDIVGFMGLFPVTRSLIRNVAQTYFKGNSGVSINVGAFAGNQGFSTTSSGQPAGPLSPNSDQETPLDDSSTSRTAELSGKAKSRPSFDH